MPILTLLKLQSKLVIANINTPNKWKVFPPCNQWKKAATIELHVFSVVFLVGHKARVVKWAGPRPWPMGHGSHIKMPRQGLARLSPSQARPVLGQEPVAQHGPARWPSQWVMGFRVWELFFPIWY